MKRYVFVLASVLFLVCLFAVGQLPLFAADSDGKQSLNQVESSFVLFGQVIDAQGKVGEDWRIQVVGADNHIADEQPLNEAGGYRFRPLSVDSYHLRVLDSERRPLSLTPFSQSQSIVVPQRGKTVVERQLVVQTETAVQSRQPTGTGQITGLLTAGDTGLPLQSVFVRAYTLDGFWVESSFTDADGRYTLTGLETGNYKVRFSHHDYVVEWYDNQLDEASATSVSVVDGATTEQIDAVLDVGGQITGQVLAEDTGMPLADVRVRLFVAGGGGGSCEDPDVEPDYYATDTTDENGRYTLTDLPSGSYRLSFEPNRFGSAKAYRPEYYNNKLAYAAADPVTVTAPNTTSGIDADLARGGQLQGQITAADTGLPLTNVFVFVYDADDHFITSARTDDNGVYTTAGLLSGSYRLAFSSFGTIYLPEYYDNQPSLELATAVSVTAPNLVGNVDAGLARGGQIQGQVTASDSGLPLDDVRITIYNDIGRFVDSVSTNEMGFYASEGLQSGSYRLRFAPSSYGESANYTTEYYNDQPSLETAQAVSVSVPNVVTGIDAALALGGQLSGQVTAAEDGRSLRGVTVWLYNHNDRTIDLEFTNNDGNYLFTGLRTGNYRLQFTYRIPLGFGCETSYFSLEEYYDDKPDLETADAVPVTAPNTVSGIDAALDLPGSFDYRTFLPTIHQR